LTCKIVDSDLNNDLFQDEIAGKKANFAAIKDRKETTIR
jgi:hypothetical protein